MSSRKHVGGIRSILLSVFLCLAATAGEAATIHVATTGNNASGDGSPRNPYRTIQFAFLIANSGDEIRVFPGTYNECINNLAIALGVQKNLSVRADDWIVNGNRTTTVIDGSGQCVFPFSVVNLAGSGTGSRFEGFTVTGAEASGVFVVGTGVVTSNVITDNTGRDGGGVYVYAGTCYYGTSDIVVSNNQITNNAADDEGRCVVYNNPCNSNLDCGAGDVCVLRGGDGGGVFVRADAVNSGGPGGCLGGEATVTIDNNIIDGNSADGRFGGGIYAFIFTQTGRSSSVTITQNLISNNSMLPFSVGYGGGAWMSTYGYGTETIEFIGNTVAYNSSTGDGGGVSAWIDSLSDANHTVVLQDNLISENTADGNGGGMDLFMFANILSASDKVSLTARNNTVTGNTAAGDRGGGGGILAWFVSWQSDTASMTSTNFTLEGNLVTGNSAAVSGGGISLFVIADARPYSGPSTLTTAEIDLANNLAADNRAMGGMGNAVGGGVFAALHAFDMATASISLGLSTVADNLTDSGAGGIEIETFTDVGWTGLEEGLAVMNVDSCVVSNNDGFGIGGPEPGVGTGILATGPGTGNLTLSVDYCDAFNHPAGNVEGWIVAGANMIFTDPLFFNSAAGDYHLTPASPAVDAGNPRTMDPATDFEGDPRVVNGRVDMGFDEVFQFNQPPVALCMDATVSAGLDCTADAAIDAGSFDPDGDSITLSQDPPGPYGLGDTLVTLTVTDDQGASGSCMATVTVEETTAPQLSVTLTPDNLWPPNHHMVDVEATVIASDNCGTPTIALISLTSNEADDALGRGDGKTFGDIQPGADDFHFSLRAERAGTGSGRIYTAVYTATDGSGNVASQAGFVVVPHDQGGVIDPVAIVLERSASGTVVSWAVVPDAESYDVIRGELNNVMETSVVISLGTVLCIEANSTDESTLGWEDGELPEPGQSFFYLVEYDDGISSSYGTEGADKPRAPGPGDCQ
ncbi:MAG: right-handed parallel beta-helix repeat-containing protein [Acidobacteria bacterium]|nr:right-handed parallel beta-helix repeat-containing protein [Acidobacteriota bacterium]